MDLDELTAVLAGPKPDRAAVLASFRRKHRRRKVRQRLCCTGAVAVGAMAAVALVTLGPWRPRGPVPPGCTQSSLAQSLVRARQAGASILIAFESPAGSAAGPGYTAVVLHSVRTLSGPTVSSGTVAWADGTAAGGADDPAVRGTGTTTGQVLAIAWPAALAGSPVGLVLRAAPVIGGNVMFPASGCTDVAVLPRPPGSGSGVVTPGSAPAGGVDATMSYAVPLLTVEAAAVSPAEGSRPGDQATPSRAAAAQSGDESPGSGATNAAGDQQGGASPSSAAHSGSSQGAGKGTSASGGNGSSASSGKSQGNGSSSSDGSDQQ